LPQLVAQTYLTNLQEYTTYKSHLGLEIDLAFTAFEDQKILRDLDRKTCLLLTEKNLWTQELKLWIREIQINTAIKCPEIIRRSKTLSLGIQLTDNLTIAKLNGAWRNQFKTTDVLSFPVLDEDLVFPDNAFIELGDIIISIPMAKEQAEQHNHELGKELRWLASHGLLHLLGWEHPSSQSLQQMLNYQEQLLSISSKVHQR